MSSSSMAPKPAGVPPPPKKGSNGVAPAPALNSSSSKGNYAKAAEKGAPIPTPSVIKFDDDVDGKRAAKLNARVQNKKQNGGGFFSWLMSLIYKAGVIYLLVGAFWTCGSRPFSFDYNVRDERAHCRTLAHTKNQLQPLLTPYYHSARAQIDPYTKPYIDKTQPYINAAWKTTRPYYQFADKQSRKYYKKNIDPLRKEAIKQARLYSDPHVKKFNSHYNKQVQPHLDQLQRNVKPYQDIYKRDVSPYVNQAYAQSLAFTSTSYHVYNSKVHPVIVKSLRTAYAFYISHVDPVIRRVFALYIRPQINKALEKVWGYKAHVLGSSTIKDVKQDVKQAGKEGKAQKDEKVAQAKASASQAVNDPSLTDRLNIAKDHITGGPLAAEDPVASAASDAELAAEQSTVKDQLEAWEKGLARLIEEEYKLSVKRVTQIRNRFSESLPDRFNILTEDVETEVEGVFSRLLKAFGKLSSSDRPLDQRIQTGKDAIDKQRAKLQRSRTKTVGSLEDLHTELQSEEVVAQKASVGEVERYIAEAQKSYRDIIAGAKFPQTKEEWSGWDKGIAVRSEIFNEELDEVRSGTKKVAPGVVAIDTGHEGDVQRQISKLVKQIETLYDTALAELGAFSSKELSALGGQSAAAAAGSVLESVVEGAKEMSGQAREVLEDAANSLSGNAGANVASQLNSRASEASASASSLARQGAKSAGIKVNPENPQEYLEDFTSRAADAAQTVYSSAGEYADAAQTAVVGGAAGYGAASVVQDAASSASSLARQGAKSAGIKVNPESPQEYIEDLTSRAADAAQTAYSSASEYVDAAQTAAAGLGAGSVVQDAASSASSLARQGAKSVGIKVNPESPGEYIEDFTSRAADAAQTAYSSASEYVDAAQTAVVGGGAGSVVQDAASSASSLARQGVKSAGFKVNPESPQEYLEDFTSKAADAAQTVFSDVREFAEAAQTGIADDAAVVASGANSVLRQAAKSAGVASVRPESPSQYLEAAAGIVADGASIAADEVYNAAHQATRTIKSAAGAEVTPETPAEYLDSLIPDGASQLASSLSSGGEQAASSVSSIASQVLDNAPSVDTRAVKSAVGISQSPDSYLEAAQIAISSVVDEGNEAGGQVYSSATVLISSAGDAIHHATRSAASAAGVKPTPESVSEYAEVVSDSISSAGEAVVSAAKSVRDEL
ncbi:unnamed protein product [Sympodiomycopsis kandeliae]